MPLAFLLTAVVADPWRLAGNVAVSQGDAGTVAVTHSGARLFATSGSAFRVYDAVGTNLVLRAERGTSALLLDIATTADGARVVTADEGGTVRLWDISAAGQVSLPPFLGHIVHRSSTAVCTTVTIAPDGNTVALGCPSGVKVYLWDPGVWGGGHAPFPFFVFTDQYTSAAVRAVDLSTRGEELVLAAGAGECVVGTPNCTVSCDYDCDACSVVLLRVSKGSLIGVPGVLNLGGPVTAVDVGGDPPTLLAAAAGVVQAHSVTQVGEMLSAGAGEVMGNSGVVAVSSAGGDAVTAIGADGVALDLNSQPDARQQVLPGAYGAVKGVAAEGGSLLLHSGTAVWRYLRYTPTRTASLSNSATSTATRGATRTSTRTQTATLPDSTRTASRTVSGTHSAPRTATQSPEGTATVTAVVVPTGQPSPASLLRFAP
eukprot:Hpha_TRINITY_DN9492_c1_g1::TRINITY_DN9492_c1_g1_i1::g.139133::m.139133